MAEETNIEKAIVEIVGMFKSAKETRIQLGQDKKEIEGIASQKRDLLDDIAKARIRKDNTIAKMRETEAWAKQEITKAKQEAREHRNLADKKKKEIFDEMQVDIKVEREKYNVLKKENKDLDDNIVGLKKKQQDIREGKG